MFKILALALVIGSIAAPAAHAECTRYQKILMTNWAKDVIKKEMKDPRSAKFSDVKVIEKSGYGCKAQIVGIVRAKNSFGAMDALRFVADASIVEKDRPAVHDVQFYQG